MGVRLEKVCEQSEFFPCIECKRHDFIFILFFRSKFDNLYLNLRTKENSEIKIT